MTMQYELGTLATCAALFVYVFLRRHRRLSAIKDVPGPANPSWIFGTSMKGQSDPFYLLLWIESAECENLQGHQWYFLTEDAGVVEKRFLENFGNTVRWNGPLGVRHTLAEYVTVVCIRILD